MRDIYYGTEKWLNAPNGKETKLTEAQWLAVRTDKFKSWFGDWESNPDEASKTIDTETLEPKVYYHGSAVNIDEFKSLANRTGVEYDNHGIYFSPNPDVASNFAVLKSKRITDGAALVYPVFLNLRNPKIAQYSRHFNREELDALSSAGFDGVTEVGGERNGYYQDDIVVVFNGDQVRSALAI